MVIEKTNSSVEGDRLHKHNIKGIFNRYALMKRERGVNRKLLLLTIGEVASKHQLA
ncbi:MAG: hypothetical protein VKK04_05880 [Synechococcales bacterium]|nr:hypothetical protein [Synechococcales bacterium]